MLDQDAVLRKIYYTPCEAGSFGGVTPLFQAAKKQCKTLTQNNVTTWLSEQDAYTLHKPARVHFKRNKTIVSGLDAQWQADLVDMQQFSKHNDGCKYILTVVDVLSKYAWAMVLKDKTGGSVSKAFKHIFKKGRIPAKLQTDSGKEFLNQSVSSMLKQHGVHHFFTHNEVKAAIVEHFNRTLKTKMWRYFTANNTFRFVDVLPLLVQSYNHSFHRTIKARPVDVNSANAQAVWKTVYGDYVWTNEKQGLSPFFRKGDHVRVSKSKGLFVKGYEQSYTDEIFIVEQVICRGKRPVYRLKDYAGDSVTGSFYPEELQKVKTKGDRVYRIEKNLASKGRGKRKYHLVKWVGWPDKFNSWVPASQLCDPV